MKVAPEAAIDTPFEDEVVYMSTEWMTVFPIAKTVCTMTVTI
jgi:hypothetical protein